MSILSMLIVGAVVVSAIIGAALAIKAIIVAGSTAERAIDESSKV